MATLRQRIEGYAEAHDLQVMLLDAGYDDALRGLAEVHSGHTHAFRAIYDRDEILNILVRRDGMTLEGALEFFDFNILPLGVGTGPVFSFLP